MSTSSGIRTLFRLIDKLRQSDVRVNEFFNERKLLSD